MSDKKKRGKSPEAVIAAISLKGLDGLDELHQGGMVSKDSVRRALKMLADLSHPSADKVRTWYNGTYGKPPAALQVGESRNYKLLTNKQRAHPFITLPIPDTVKGQPVQVTRVTVGEFRVAVVG